MKWPGFSFRNIVVPLEIQSLLSPWAFKGILDAHYGFSGVPSKQVDVLTPSTCRYGLIWK